MKSERATRDQVLRAALRQFADRGYAGTSVQDIVDAARVTKPTLYYYFPNKAGLYRALVDFAQDERYRLMQEAVARGGSLEQKLVEILSVLFAFLQGHREVMRIAFHTAFASPGEIPREIQYGEKCCRNFEFVRALMEQGIASGALDGRHTAQELALGLYGMMNIYVMSFLLKPDPPLTRKTARRIVALFLQGAGADSKRENK